MELYERATKMESGNNAESWVSNKLERINKTHNSEPEIFSTTLKSASMCVHFCLEN